MYFNNICLFLNYNTSVSYCVNYIREINFHTIQNVYCSVHKENEPCFMILYRRDMKLICIWAIFDIRDVESYIHVDTVCKKV